MFMTLSKRAVCECVLPCADSFVVFALGQLSRPLLAHKFVACRLCDQVKYLHQPIHVCGVCTNLFVISACQEYQSQCQPWFILQGHFFPQHLNTPSKIWHASETTTSSKAPQRLLSQRQEGSSCNGPSTCNCAVRSGTLSRCWR